MPCYRPLNGWFPAEKHPRDEHGNIDYSKKNGIVFSLADGYKDKPVAVPCGQCTGCRLERARMWAVRCVHEASLFDANSFVTLTYDNKHYPANGSLNVEDMQKFLKRLREKYTGQTIRFFQCGEYGEDLGRPHHHVLFFNYRPADLQRVSGDTYFSPELEKLWPFGFNAVGNVSFESAAYVASYCIKKITGPMAPSHYLGRKPEFVTMSRRPGIGRLWFDSFARSDVYRDGTLMIRGGIRVKIPRYYDELFGALDGDKLELLKIRRKVRAMKSPDNTVHRIIDRGEVARLNVISRQRERKLK